MARHAVTFLTDVLLEASAPDTYPALRAAIQERLMALKAPVRVSEPTERTEDAIDQDQITFVSFTVDVLTEADPSSYPNLREAIARRLEALKVPVCVGEPQPRELSPEEEPTVTALVEAAKAARPKLTHELRVTEGEYRELVPKIIAAKDDPAKQLAAIGEVLGPEVLAALEGKAFGLVAAVEKPKTMDERVAPIEEKP